MAHFKKLFLLCDYFGHAPQSQLLEVLQCCWGGGLLPHRQVQAAQCLPGGATQAGREEASL